jgi:hypothetical protein
MSTASTERERILSAARDYGVQVFGAAHLQAVEIVDPGVSVGNGRSNWLVEVESPTSRIMVSVLVDADGRTEVLHHTRLAA